MGLLYEGGWIGEFEWGEVVVFIEGVKRKFYVGVLSLGDRNGR